MTENTDPYLYPGTNILRNLRGLRDPLLLAHFEADCSASRLDDLQESPIPGRFDIAHLKSIHKYIFQDIFDWAGNFRTVNISKGGHLFASAAYLEPALEGVFKKFAKEDYLRQLDIDRFSTRAGFYLGEINRAHPFAKARAEHNANSYESCPSKPAISSIGDVPRAMQ
jgi:cell filamentation protein